MRLLLPISLAAAVVSVGATGYMFIPSPGRKPVTASRLIAADPSPVRVIPLASGTSPADPIRNAAAAAKPPVPAAQAEAKAVPSPAIAPAPVQVASADPAQQEDVLASVGRTLDGIKAAESGSPAQQAEAVPSGIGALTQAQAEALRGMAGRRKVRPVTRMSFPLEIGGLVPQPVYLHPVPPEVAGLAPAEGGLGFAVVNDRYVVVDTQSRRIVAMTEAR